MPRDRVVLLNSDRCRRAITRAAATTISAVQAITYLCFLRPLAAEGQRVSTTLPVSIKIPARFRQIVSSCCSATVRVAGFWRDGSGEQASIINILEESIGHESLKDYVTNAVILPGQSRSSISFERRCGTMVAFMTSTGDRIGVPIWAIQAVIVTGTRAITVGYVRPRDVKVDVQAVNAVRNICLVRNE